VKGRRVAKAQKGSPVKDKEPFDIAFDRLLQAVNYKETHGIPIGPEMSRIFAEIILQRIDLNVAARLKEEGLEIDKAYCCRRYVDDIFFFFNNEEEQKIFLRILSEELRVYKLHLNEDKMLLFDRPFITNQSVFKQRISEYISSFWARIDRIRIRDSAKEIARLRASCPFGTVGFNAVAALFFASMRNRIRTFDAKKHNNAAEILYVVADLVFHAFRMDLSASSSYKITELVLDIIAYLPDFSEHEKAKLNDKLIFELRGATLSAIAQGYHVEAINVLIALRELKVESAIIAEFSRNLLTLSRQAHREEGEHKPRLNYFCVVGLLYALRGKDKTTTTELVNDAEEILLKYTPSEYAESAYLLLDLVSCPFLGDPEKDRLIKVGIVRHKPSASASDIGQFRKYVAQHTWFFNWNNNNNLRTHLQKKKFLPAY